MIRYGIPMRQISELKLLRGPLMAYSSHTRPTVLVAQFRVKGIDNLCTNNVINILRRRRRIQQRPSQSASGYSVEWIASRPSRISQAGAGAGTGVMRASICVDDSKRAFRRGVGKGRTFGVKELYTSLKKASLTIPNTLSTSPKFRDSCEL